MSAEDEARAWMETILGEKFEGGFCDALKSGERLIRLANAIKANTIIKYNKEPTMPIKKSENITFFLKAIRTWGMTEYQMFETSDIDKGNMKPVVNCLHALGSLLQSKPEFESPSLPKLGIKAVEKHVSLVFWRAFPLFSAPWFAYLQYAVSMFPHALKHTNRFFLFLFFSAPFRSGNFPTNKSTKLVQQCPYSI